MTEDDVERVAKAICASDRYGYWQIWLPEARAAIAAMGQGQPVRVTDEMVASALTALHSNPGTFSQAMRAVLEAALGAAPGGKS